MSFTDTQAPPFTRENAADMARRAVISREARREAKRIAAEAAKPRIQDEEARRQRTLTQLDGLDKLIDSALRKHDAELFLKLTAAKGRLWKLVAPTAGVLRPKRAGEASRRPSIAPIAVEIPDQTPQAPAAPAASEPQG